MSSDLRLCIPKCPSRLWEIGEGTKINPEGDLAGTSRRARHLTVNLIIVEDKTFTYIFATYCAFVCSFVSAFAWICEVLECDESDEGVLFMGCIFLQSFR